MSSKKDDKIVIPEDLSTLSDSDLHDLHDRSVGVFQGLLPEDGSSPTDESLQALSALAEGIEALKGEVTKREAAALARSTSAKEIADRILAKPEPVEAPVAEAEAAPVPVAASGLRRAPGRRGRTRPVINIDLGSLAKPATVEEPVKPTTLALAAQGAAGFDVGRPLTLRDMAVAINSRLGGFNVATYQQAANRGQRVSERFAIARIPRTFDESLVVVSEDPRDAINAAVDQKRLPAGSLTASGGWCSPSETLYDLINVSDSADLVSVPEIQINRGGVRHTLGPKYSDIYTDSGFCYTEAEDIDGDYDGAGAGKKPCFYVSCEDFTDVRLGYCGVCISAGLLQQRGYPELIEHNIEVALAAHMHRVSAAVLNDMVSASTAITWGSTNMAGATAPLLTAIDLQAAHLRAASRMPANAVLEVVLPTWAKPLIRSDLARRLGVDLLSVTDARVSSWFADRDVNVQYVVDWQDIATTAAASFTAPPTSVKFLLYPAGAFVKGVTDSIMLENIYDSVGLRTNDFTALFTEDPYLVLKRLHDTRVVTVAVEATGNAHFGTEIKPNGTYVPA